MKDDLVMIHELLMKVETHGESIEPLYLALSKLTTLIKSIQKEKDKEE